MSNRGSAIVVGGSIGGLAAAIALARAGIRTSVLESRTTFDGRGGLGVDYRLLCEAIGENPDHARAHLAAARRDDSTPLYGWLTEVAARVDYLDMRPGTEVTKVRQDADKAYATLESYELAADILLGADGHHSLVRAEVNPDHPHTQYAGFLTWRGWITTDLPADTTLTETDPLEFSSGPQYLVAVPLPGLDDTAEGLRTIGFAWHDPTRTELLEHTGCLRDGTILRDLDMSVFPPGLRQEMIDTARRLWPQPWREAIAACFENNRAVGAPVGNYLPERLAAGRVALLGEAAHTVAPATGQGYNASVEDVIALRDSVTGGVARDAGPAALSAYEGRRLSFARDLVRWSMQWSNTFASERR